MKKLGGGLRTATGRALLNETKDMIDISGKGVVKLIKLRGSISGNCTINMEVDGILLDITESNDGYAVYVDGKIELHDIQFNEKFRIKLIRREDRNFTNEIIAFALYQLED